MDFSKQKNDARHEKDKLRNYDLTVDEIRLIKSIEDMTRSVDRLEQMDPQSSRAKIIRLEIEKLEDKLEELRDNTLIR